MLVLNSAPYYILILILIYFMLKGTQQVLQRKYVALVMGTPRHPKGLLSAPLAKVLLQDGKSERLTVRAGPNTTSVQDALTEYRVIESCPRGFTWLELFPLTGRKHQRFSERRS
uniref:Uncharacterized protein n=1 Tax=Aegilops tauschii subsp. strangulata TaxID=200361 RepID=A0A453KG24_AEGTS